ncbi:hypothetical protein BP6252_06544 [Coleophoma cylindrospora]|uniref:Rhodopsin domain-containing protein n=1 Tax=Coleophoma cylindrospora TaxID=1849047 RepID=A0A3D8RMS8_9HELO|nr:hypothetical protein BP6252_06544 [Coleophoma cylindrospora]
MTASDHGDFQMETTVVIFVILAVIFVILRFISRYMKRIGFGIDDYTLFMALIFLFIAAALNFMGLSYGVGKHSSDLSFDSLVSFGKTLLAFECVYVTSLAITKCSLLIMYCRIFPVYSIKLGAYMLGFLAISWATSIIMVSIFQCTPIAKAWNSHLVGHCINLRASFIGNAVPNILTDVAILMLPMPQVWKLHTGVLQKAQLSCIFLLGSFVVFTSVYRFTTVFQFSTSDRTYTIRRAWTWCVVEAASGIISACLPTINPIIRLLYRPFSYKSSHSKSLSSSSTTGQNVQLENIRNTKVMEHGTINHPRIGSCGSSTLLSPSGESRFELPKDQSPEHDGKGICKLKSHDSRDAGEGSNLDDDNVPLYGTRTRTDLEWSEERKKEGNLNNSPW